VERVDTAPGDEAIGANKEEDAGRSVAVGGWPAISVAARVAVGATR